MGMFSWSTGCDCNKCEPKETLKETIRSKVNETFKSLTKYKLVKDMDPNTHKFIILDYIEKSGGILVKIQYPNCTNYEGIKILLFKDKTIKQIQAMDSIDPHFLINDTSLLARFVPTDSGWILGWFVLSELDSYDYEQYNR
jgi:hypothetical protein